MYNSWQQCFHNSLEVWQSFRECLFTPFFFKEIQHCILVRRIRIYYFEDGHGWNLQSSSQTLCFGIVGWCVIFEEPTVFWCCSKGLGPHSCQNWDNKNCTNQKSLMYLKHNSGMDKCKSEWVNWFLALACENPVSKNRRLLLKNVSLWWSLKLIYRNHIEKLEGTD